METKKQTAVEWLVEQIHSEEYTHAFGKTYISVLFVEQAIAMEKEQIIAAYRDGRTDQQSGIDKFYNRSSAIYYTSTFEQ
jgi:hypothetical protein